MGRRRRAHPVPDRRLRYTKSTRLWAIYWRDRHLELPPYELKRPNKNVQALLDHIQTSGDPIFWGWRATPLTIHITEDNVNYMRTEAPLLAPIFRSAGQARLLSAILLTGDELSITDLAEHAGLAYPTAHREVSRLLEAGILTEREVGRTRLIRANDQSPLVEPLREILTVTTGPVVMLARELADIDGIESAFLYGSFAARLQGEPGPVPHDIDLMVVGRPDVDAVYEACTRVEESVRRPINPTILTSAELAEPSGFLETVRDGPAVAVIGELPWR
jgi:DNA-binding transcriptional ArsR family regulator